MASSVKIALVLSLFAAPLLCGLADDQTSHSFPILTRIGKDPSTSLYTSPIKDGGGRLVLDLAGSLIWSTCAPDHPKIGCDKGACKVAMRNRRPSCPTVSPGGGGGYCACTVCPVNPASGQCGSGELTTVRLAANATDGKNPLFQVSSTVVASCAPGEMLASLPSGAAGVAGLSRGPLSLPLQVAAKQKLAKQFALCLPDGGNDGAAIIGGGPFWLQSAIPQQVSDRLSYTALLKNPINTAYYIGVTGIAVNENQVPLPPGALSLSAGQHTGGVVLSTTTPYTALRSDIYRPLRDAFDKATAGIGRAPQAPKPFDLCYKISSLTSTRVGLYTASIDLMLAGGKNWTMVGSNVVVEVVDQADTACFAFIDMAYTATPAVEQSPAVVIGGHQMEDNLLAFDLDKWQFGFSGLLLGTMTTCSNFDFNVGWQDHP